MHYNPSNILFNLVFLEATNNPLLCRAVQVLEMLMQ